jgi:NAD(P)-dependent dehydrogenase (short-subunit alcohol dehydrogenase family)
MNRPHAETRALVTGAAQGLGLAIARELIDQGCTRLALADVNAEAGRKVAEELSKDGVQAEFLHVDLADTEAAMAMVDEAVRRLGGLNALVNAAALTDRSSILDTDPAFFDLIFAINTKAPFFALQRFARHCIDQGQPGTCVNILSVMAHCGMPFIAPYSASKAALLNVTKNAANALAKDRIRINGICVGWMDTPGENRIQTRFHDREEGWQQQVEATLPFGMLVKPEHVAGQVAFYLGPQSGVVTGSIMDFDQKVIGSYPDFKDR